MIPRALEPRLDCSTRARLVCPPGALKRLAAQAGPPAELALSGDGRGHSHLPAASAARRRGSKGGRAAGGRRRRLLRVRRGNCLAPAAPPRSPRTPDGATMVRADGRPPLPPPPAAAGGGRRPPRPAFAQQLWRGKNRKWRPPLTCPRRWESGGRGTGRGLPAGRAARPLAAQSGARERSGAQYFDVRLLGSGEALFRLHHITSFFFSSQNKK